MFKKVLFIYGIVGFSFLCSAVGFNGLDIPDWMNTGNSKLILNGVGERTYFFIDIYAGALYLEKKCNDAKEIINSDKPMAITLHITSSLITSSKMKSATLEGFENSTNKNITPIKKKIDSLLDVFTETINPGDIYKFLYLPQKGLEIFKNGKLTSTIPGLKFKQAFFGIWLCDNPPTNAIKSGMLGEK